MDRSSSNEINHYTQETDATVRVTDKSPPSQHKGSSRCHTQRRLTKPYSRKGSVASKDETTSPLDMQSCALPASKTPSSRQSSVSKARSRVGKKANRINASTGTGTAPTVTASAPAPISVPGFKLAKAREIAADQLKPLKSDFLWFTSGNPPHFLPELATPEEYQEKFGLARKYRD
ncbi:hypothetical protein BJ165DRAFT_1533183 [Panaeolus papilionaceus]|nr:hypothetical protein BJ165DRAFT_1533183 [Panaeolus papilionaceus]